MSRYEAIGRAVWTAGKLGVFVLITLAGLPLVVVWVLDGCRDRWPKKED